MVSPLLFIIVVMRIVHICLSAPYVDGWGYQENLLPEYLKKNGVENHIITSNDNLPIYLSENMKDEIVKKGDSYNIGDIKIHKIKGRKITTMLLIPYGLRKKIEEIRPDVIFHHNVSVTTLPIVSKYAKKHNCKLFVDNHADEINMSKNKLWIWLYYKFLSRISCRIRKDAFTKFYGVTNSRCDFISKYFGVPNNKIELLPIGADTDLAGTIDDKDTLRRKYGFSHDDNVVVTGGKMGIDKGTIDLINAIDELNGEKDVKLLLFGKFEDEATLTIAMNKNFVTIHNWCDRIKTLELLKLADVACWPLHHTTLIEDAIAVETPLIIRKTRTTSHLVDGNGLWLDNGNKGELKDTLFNFFVKGQDDLSSIQMCCRKMKEYLSYDNISRTILQTINNM